MKSMARAILFTSIVAATGAAVGDKLSTALGDPDKQAPESSMPADRQAHDPTVSTEPTAATSPEGQAADIAASSTYALPQPNEFTTVTPSPSSEMVAANPPAEGMAPAPRPVEATAPTPRPAEPVARRAARPAYVVASAPSAFPSSVDDNGHYLVARVTHSDRFGTSSVMFAGSAFPTSVDDAGYYLIARTTFADLQLARSTRVAQADRRIESGN